METPQLTPTARVKRLRSDEYKPTFPPPHIQQLQVASSNSNSFSGFSRPRGDSNGSLRSIGSSGSINNLRVTAFDVPSNGSGISLSDLKDFQASSPFARISSFGSVRGLSGGSWGSLVDEAWTPRSGNITPGIHSCASTPRNWTAPPAPAPVPAPQMSLLQWTQQQHHQQQQHQRQQRQQHPIPAPPPAAQAQETHQLPHAHLHVQQQVDQTQTHQAQIVNSTEDSQSEKTDGKDGDRVMNLMFDSQFQALSEQAKKIVLEEMKRKQAANCLMAMKNSSLSSVSSHDSRQCSSTQPTPKANFRRGVVPPQPSAELPDGWSRHLDKKRWRVYYYNCITRHSTWTHPSEPTGAAADAPMSPKSKQRTQ